MDRFIPVESAFLDRGTKNLDENRAGMSKPARRVEVPEVNHHYVGMYKEIHFNNAIEALQKNAKASQYVTETHVMKPAVAELLKRLPEDAYSHRQGGPEWLQTRSSKITSTDAGVIMGCTHGRTWDQVMREKCGIDNKQPVSDFARAAMAFGRETEPWAAAEYAQKRKTTLMTVGLVTHPKLSWLAASPDRVNINDNCLVEIKCLYRQRQPRKEVPASHYIQMQIAMFCCGFDKCHYVEYIPPTPKNGMNLTMSVRVVTLKTKFVQSMIPALQRAHDNLMSMRNDNGCHVELPTFGLTMTLHSQYSPVTHEPIVISPSAHDMFPLDAESPKLLPLFPTELDIEFVDTCYLDDCLLQDVNKTPPPTVPAKPDIYFQLPELDLGKLWEPPTIDEQLTCNEVMNEPQDTLQGELAFELTKRAAEDALYEYAYNNKKPHL